MINKNPSRLSNEDLLHNERKVKATSLSFTGIVIALFSAVIYLTKQKGFTVLIAVPIVLLPLLIISLNNWNALKKEIKVRNLQ